MKPFELIPPVKDYIWGGSRLVEEYDAPGESDKVGELWMLSCHPSGFGSIANGELAGVSLPDAVAKYPEICGKNAENFS